MTMISSQASQAAAAAVPSKSEGALSQLAADSETFIKMLVAQIQNQDPTNPMESTDFVSQTAQLTQVEQAIQTNRNIESLQASLSLNAALNQTSLIGREVTTASPTFVLGADGASFSYALESAADSVSALIRDGSGKLVRQIDGLPGAGGRVFDVSWDGLDDDGIPVPPGEFRIDLATPGGNGSYETFTTSTVQAVEFAGGMPMLRLADGRYASSTDIFRAE